MQYTPNYNFDLPEENDEMETATRTALDDNFTDLDTLLKDIEDDIDDIQDDISGLNDKTGDDIPFESGSGDSISDKITILSNLLSTLNGAETRTLLWTNPIPTSAFGQQTITISNLNVYDQIEIEFNEYNEVRSLEIYKTDATIHGFYITKVMGDSSISSKTSFVRRQCAINNGSISFSRGAFRTYDASWVESDISVVPIKIYGIKTISI